MSEREGSVIELAPEFTVVIVEGLKVLVHISDSAGEAQVESSKRTDIPY